MAVCVFVMTELNLNKIIYVLGCTDETCLRQIPCFKRKPIKSGYFFVIFIHEGLWLWYWIKKKKPLSLYYTSNIRILYTSMV